MLKARQFGSGVGSVEGSIEGIDSLFETGQIEHILATIDNIINGEVNLPPGGHDKLFERIREVGKGYTVIGTKYTYNTRNQLVHREDLIRYEEYDYSYDDAGNLLTDARSKYEWNARGQLTKVTFPDGFGEKYAYDMLGRRISKTRFNHTGETQEVTNYVYKGDTWVITEERDGAGEVTKSYSYDTNERPLTITYKGQTYWYVYNGHGDVVALTDGEGQVAARYEYDAWGLVTGMYNRYGERVREGIGWMGDLGSGNGSPGSLQGPEGESGNTEPDYHPGNGNANGKANGKAKSKPSEEQTATGDSVAAEETVTDTSAGVTDLVTEEAEPTEDITTELVKENPYRYAAYYWDRKTQYYYLQSRYYDPRSARFISEDTYEGEINNPLTLNLYTYVENNPLNYTDPSGHRSEAEDNTGRFVKPTYEAYEEAKLLIYQTEIRKNPEDMQYNDKSKKQLEDILNFWLYEDNFKNKDEDDWRRDFESLVRLTSIGDMEDIALDMVDHFMSGTGTPYRNNTLTNKVRNKGVVKEYVSDIKETVKKLLKQYNGDTSKLKYNAAGRDNSLMVNEMK